MAEKGVSARYAPEDTDSHDPHEIARWAMREFVKIRIALDAGKAREIEFLHVEPAKLREGMIVGADGTDWNPGSGQGIYAYYGGTWNKL